ncbi:hypothetical protein [Iodidimonas sp. SYSU 1G8]|uniref:hypothetical protein n=1 Tax=Iodidimonas sp. SYSU 1G8 TaxID=3133967 RepID=UPI0031FEA7B1
MSEDPITHGPLYKQFVAAHTASLNNTDKYKDDLLARQMLLAGSHVVSENCDIYFSSNGRIERRLLFYRDITSGSAAVAITSAALAGASATATSGIALAFTTLLGANDTYRKQLTFGAEFSSSAQTMVQTQIFTLRTAMMSDTEEKYTYAQAIENLRLIQNVCRPAVIQANMAAAIATKRFDPIKIEAPATKIGGDDSDTPTPNTGSPPPAQAVKPDSQTSSGSSTVPTTEEKNNAKSLIEDLKEIKPYKNTTLDKNIDKTIFSLQEMASGKSSGEKPDNPAISSPKQASRYILVPSRD